MSKILLTLCLIAWVLCSCGSESLAPDLPTYKARVIITSDRYVGDAASYFSPTRQYYADQKESVKFYAGITINDKTYSGDTIYNFIESILWNIDGANYTLPTFRYSFLKAGHKTGFLVLKDYLGDTARIDLDFYVNTPNKVSLLYPYDGFNQAETSEDQKLPLRWALSGLDEWESANCKIFISNSEYDVWDNPVGNVDCSDEVTLTGSLIEGKYDTAIDSSFNLFWAVEATIHSEGNFDQRDSSNVARFSTKIINDAYSQIKVPLYFENYHEGTPLKTEITIVSGTGDTLEVLYNEKGKTTINTQIKPQSGVKVYVRELESKEFSAESVTVDIPQNTVVLLDTIVLKDKIPPQAAPFMSPILAHDMVQFTVYDDGSGINNSKVRVIFMNDTISSVFRAPNLKFDNLCWGKCKLQIIAEDYAKNPLPDVYWMMERVDDSLYINGPYITGVN